MRKLLFLNKAKILPTIIPLIFIATITKQIDYPNTLNLINKNKEYNWKNIADQRTISLALLITTGDKTYEDRKLKNLFKESQIIHLLVISGSNIIVFLQFVNIFILRKTRINAVMGGFLIFLYLKYTGYPETLIRALESYIFSETVSSTGMKVSRFVYIITCLTIFISTFILLELGLSYKLSAIYSLSILIFDKVVCYRKCSSKLTKFIFFNVYITLISHLLFYNYGNFSTCISFFANIFITQLFEYAVLISYTLYFLPNVEGIEVLSYICGLLLQLLSWTLEYIGFIKDVTYNLCYVK